MDAAPRWATRATASSAMATTSCERAPDAVATKPTPQASCSRAGSSAGSAALAACRWGPERVLREPAGWIRCPVAAMVPPAGGCPLGRRGRVRGNKKPAPLRERAGIIARATSLPGRSRGADGIKQKDRGEATHDHERIIMHRGVFVNPAASCDRPAALDSPRRPHVSLTNAADAPSALHLPDLEAHRLHMLSGLCSLVVVLLGLLLTSLIGEPGVRGVPTRAT